jgi:hypothetical protein
VGGSVTRSGERSLSNSVNYFSNLYLALYGDKVSSSSKCSKGIHVKMCTEELLTFGMMNLSNFMPRGLVVRCISCLRRADEFANKRGV